MYKKGLKRLVSGMTVFGMMFSMLAPMANAVDNDIQVNDVDYSKVPKLLITELVPDTTNVGPSDGYEFIEVYNNSDRTLDFKDYNLVYRNAGADTIWPASYKQVPYGSMPIPSQSSIVFWVTNADNVEETPAKFNSTFTSNLQEGVNLFRVEGGGGMSNAGPRSLVIQEKTGSDISIASYQNDNQTKPNKGIFYKSPVNGSKNMVMYGSGEDTTPANATPGVIDPMQVPPIPLTYSEPPVINHTPVTQADQKLDLTLQAQIANPEQSESVSAAVYFKTGSQAAYDSVPMTVLASTQYQATIPKEKLTDTPLKYYVQADDGFSTIRSNVYSATVAIDKTDFTKIPQLLVTEVVPDSTNVGTADGYEFIEVYNNTDKAINFKDYQLIYRYTDTGPDADVIWPADKEDMIIPSKGTLVFWVINAQNANTPVADFNTTYGTNLVEGTNLVRIHNDGMANGSNRGILIATNTGVEVSSAYYVTGDAKANKGILYKYPVDGKTTMTKYSAGLVAATPGTLDPTQAPIQSVIVKPDTTKPVISDLTKETEIEQSKDLEIIADAKDETSLKTVALYYKTEKQPNYSKKYLKESFADTLYHYTVFSPELIGNAYLEYYFVTSDGVNETTSTTKRVAITGGADHSALRLNVKDGDVIAKPKVIKGTGEGLGADDLKLAIDGKELTQSTYHAVEHDAYIAFEVTGVNYYFKNAITQDKDILFTFQDTVNSYTTLSTTIQADRLKEGSNVFSIRAGSKASPFDDRPAENKDNFDVKNVRLVLADGTVIYDAKNNDPAKVIKMGDSSGKPPVVDFDFVIPAEKLASKAYVWDTTSTNDGQHQITVSHGNDKAATSTVTVDNTAPVIKPSVEEGVMYRGDFNLDAVISDALAGVDKVETTFDTQPITLPYATSSAKLPGGMHVFSIKAVDKVGNVQNVTINFEVPNEIPNLPEQLTPGQGAVDVDRNAPLSVKVSDPMNDEMNVSFNQGFKYDASVQGQFAGYRNAVDTEPPRQEKPDGETAFSQEDYTKISALDGQYLVDDSDEKFPYQRFEISLDDAIKSTDKVEINWKGKSLEGRKVTLYAWSPSGQKWNLLKTVIAGTADFELQATVAAGTYANNKKIQVMVQDEIAAAPVQANADATADYDFSFVWMSDTQYYSRTYPYIYQEIVKWIADHKVDNKIKYVIHTGDIVDIADQEYQWIEADKDMKVLEKANIPYGVLAGNHDVGHQNNDYSYYSKWFGEDRFKDQPTYGESYENNKGHYDLVSSNGNDFIIVYMGWGYGDKEIDWINEVLKKYPNRKAILNFHEFMLVSNNRAPMAEKVFERVIKPNKNVIAALSGHYHDAELKVDAIDDNNDGLPDRNVYQMLADYQGAPEGGLGYIRLMQFDMAHGKINMKTYSPHLDDYNYYDPAEYPGKDEFSIDLNLQPVTKRVATDYFGVNVYTDNMIGSMNHVKSGEVAGVIWKNLAPLTSYQWYAAATDMYGGVKKSDIWKLTTGTTSTEYMTGLSLSSGDLNEPFYFSRTSYTQSVVNSVDSLTVTPTLTNETASVTVNGNTVRSGQASEEIPLSLGDNTITIVHTAADSSTRTYTVHVTRMSNNVLLSNIAVNQGSLNPAFSASQRDYAVGVSNSVSEVNLSITKEELYQKLTVTGAEFTAVTDHVYAYKAANLKVGANPIEIMVEAQDGTKKPYNLTVYRAEDSSSEPYYPTPPTTPIDDKVTSTDGTLTLPIGKTGEVSYKDEVSISIPANASMKELKLTIEKLTGTDNLLTNHEVLASPVYEILKNFTENFSKSVTLTFAFDPTSVKADQRASVFYFDEVNQKWVEVKGGKINGNHITVDVNHFTKYAVMATPKEDDKPITDNPGTDGTNLTDIKGHWAEASIRELIGQGAINGYPDGTFKPEGRITRAEFVSIVVKFLKLGDQGDKAFSDTTNHWAKNAIATAAANGIISGYTDTTFGPDDTITREQMAVIIVRAAHMNDKGTEGMGFTDSSAISEWAQAAVAVLTSKGLLNGYQDGTLKPQGISTRAEASAIILRSLKK
ncbi:S-layer homology domain-containing protein [Paenibacillus sp. LjRoot56]|uniref:S-layer homology domain-containing protein n=1 Tax=Paenibacillus sp. LjRoot56 TaxID=3342333 RepID=UPI003ECD8F17